MKDADAKRIKDICDSNLSNDKQMMQEAQSILRNIGPLKKLMSGRQANVPMKALEKVLAKMVKKYCMYIRSILVITDIHGNMTYHVDVSKPNLSRIVWLFTIHSDTIYEAYVKLVLMSFVAIKQGKVVKRS